MRFAAVRSNLPSSGRRRVAPRCAAPQQLVAVPSQALQSIVGAASATRCFEAAASPLQPSSLRRFSSTQEHWDDYEDVDLDSIAYGFMASQALFAALEIGLFDLIAEAGQEGVDIATLRRQCVDAPRLQTLVTALTTIKCLRRSPEGMYTLSSNTAQYMVKQSRFYYGDYLKYQIGRQFYPRMGDLSQIMLTGEGPNYASWLSDPDVAESYTQAQHNGSIATARYLLSQKLKLGGISSMLDVGGGSGAFSYVFVEATPGLESTVLELPEVCRTSEGIRAEQPEDVRNRVRFMELDATKPAWPVEDNSYDLVLMSYLSGSVPEPAIRDLYANALNALRPGGRLVVHDFMVSDTLDRPALGALWGLQHVTLNAAGLGLTAQECITRMVDVGFDASNCEACDMIHDMTRLIVATKGSQA